jgi:hypothetical protein
MTDWKIQSRAHACAACNKGFKDKEVYHTLLFDEKSEFRRSDICESCWEQQYSQGARERKGFVSYWHGLYEAPPAPTDAIQKQTAESLLRKLIELNDPKYIPAAYILAVMLERKRIFKVKEQTVRDGQRYFIYEQHGTGDVFTILDPGLQLTQLETVQRDVAALLEDGPNPPAEQPSSAPPDSAAPVAEADAPLSVPTAPAVDPAAATPEPSPDQSGFPVSAE